MNYLLDTHVLIWWLTDDPTLSAKARVVLASDKSELYLSAASLWEMRIKQRKGTLTDFPDVLAQLEKWRVKVVPVGAISALEAPMLSLPHSDPFDKMIFYHAKQHNFTLLTGDSILLKQTIYQVTVINAKK